MVRIMVGSVHGELTPILLDRPVGLLQATVEAVFFGVDDRREWAGLRGTRRVRFWCCRERVCYWSFVGGVLVSLSFVVDIFWSGSVSYRQWSAGSPWTHGRFLTAFSSRGEPGRRWCDIATKCGILHAVRLSWWRRLHMYSRAIGEPLSL